MKQLGAGHLLRGVALAALLSLGATTLAGCSNASTLHTTKGKISVVVSVNTWGGIAETVGGKYVSVTSLISDWRQDPHGYQATVRDQLAVNQAKLVIANGQGYDNFVNSLIPTKKSKLVTIAQEFPADVANGNPHLWYSLATDIKVTNLLAERLAAIDSIHAKYFRSNAKELVGALTRLQGKERTLASAVAGRSALAVESIADYMLRDCGIRNATPTAFALAVQNDTEIPPQALADAKALITQRKVSFLLLSLQAISPTDRSLEALATKLVHGQQLSQLGMSELRPAKQTFARWMEDNVTNLFMALQVPTPDITVTPAEGNQ